MQRIVLAFLLVLQLSCVFVQAQTIVYVAPDGTGNGTSWANPSGLQDAVDNASAGDELWLRQGTYNVSTTITFNKRLEIMGGFSGSGDQRDPDLYPSIIDGQGSVHMIQTGSGSSNTLFDGISFINGYANTGADNNDIKGGALYISGSGTRINNCVFRDNTSENRIGSGAIYLWSVDNVVIENSLFENNRVLQSASGSMGGGAIHVRFGSNTRIINTSFRNNYSFYNGGAVHDWGNNTLFENCVFEDNTTEEDGGAVYINGYITLFEDCVFDGNESGGDGGGVYVGNDYTHVTNCTFIGNRGTDGGGIASNFGGIEIRASYFEGNQAQERGGAVYNHRFAEPSIIERSRFSENTADLGGAIYNFSEEGLKVLSSLFVDNQATDEGGAVFNYRFIEITNATFVANNNTALVHNRFQTAQTTIYNSIFYLNTAKNSNYLADITSSEGETDESNRDVRNNIVQEFSGGTNNQIVDPLFVNNASDFRLQPSSPAINTGDESLYNDVSDIDADNSTDLDGNPRHFGANIDIGAYEFQDEPIETIPNCTSITAPLGGATDVSLLPTIEWGAVANVTGYRLTIGTTATDGEVLDNEDVGDVISYTLTAELEENTVYYIRVVPYNDVGLAEDCSAEIISFTTEILPTLPDCTTIISPVNGAEDVALDAAITWEEVDGADGYYVTIGTTPGGSDIADNVEVTGTSFNPPVDFPENETIYVSVVPFNSTGEAEGCTEISFTTEILLEAPGCTIITSPEYGATDVGLSAGIIWQVVDGADGYRVFIGTTPGGTDVVNGEEVTDSSFSPADGWDEDQTYYIRVVPFNTAGEADGCGEISFTTEAVLEAPDCTVINAPVNGAGDVSLDATITWEEVDNADGYLIYIGTTSGGTDVVDGEEVAGTSFIPADGWDEGETYYVRVVPYHADGEATGCAEISFTTVARPEPPQADDQQFCPPATVADLVAVGTDIRWYDQATGGSPLSATTVLSTGTYYATQTVGDLESDRRTVAITVQSPTAPQFVGDITGCGSLTVADLEDVETGLRWYDQATGGTALSPTTALSTGTYYASRVSGTCESDRTAVQVIINVTPVPDVPDQTFVVGSTFADLNIIGQNLRWYMEPSGSTPFDPQTVISDGTYYVSQTIDGCESDRVIVQINITPVPGCVTNISPTDNATNVSVGANITWDAVAEAEGYRIYIGTASGSADVVDGAEVTGTSYNLTGGFDEGTTYYVIVIPYNDAGEAEGCPEISFTTEAEGEPTPATPECTVIVLPTDGATDVGIDAAITWEAVDNADGYLVYIGTTPGGTDVVNGVEVTGTSFTPVEDWDEGQTYYVRVVPFNTAGEADGCGEISFTTEEDDPSSPVVPECTTITAPTNGATEVSLDAGITWEPVEHADGYRIYMGTASGGTEIANGEEVTGTTFRPANGWEENTTYYVTIVPYNEAGEAESCTSISFTTETLLTIPGCTTIISPAEGTGSPSLDAGIIWTAVDGAEGYLVSIGTTPGGTDVVNEEEVTGTTFDPGVIFAENTRYYLTVTPFNAAGEARGCGQTWFVIIPNEDDAIKRTKYGFSPNDDGINDFWQIDGIENYPDNTVSVFNRWGDMVFQIQNYDNVSKMFNGVANKMTNLGAGVLPSGTYFFTIQYRDNQEMKKVNGFLVLRR